MLDSNVWLALAMDRHAHHQAALKWFEGVPDDRSACFCRMTQISFLRLLTSQAIFQEDTLSNEQAIQAYRQLRLDPRVGWMDEPAGLEAKWLAAASLNSSSPKCWMDACLFAFASLSGAQLVTFDGGFRQYESRGLNLVVLTGS